MRVNYLSDLSQKHTDEIAFSQINRYFQIISIFFSDFAPHFGGLHEVRRLPHAAQKLPLLPEALQEGHTHVPSSSETDLELPQFSQNLPVFTVPQEHTQPPLLTVSGTGGTAAGVPGMPTPAPIKLPKIVCEPVISLRVHSPVSRHSSRRLLISSSRVLNVMPEGPQLIVHIS